MDQPNYVLFITDQQRFDNLGCYGHPVLQTPNIDQMADEGVVFDRFYVASPVCMPNRASLMTCRLPSSHGVRSLGIPLAHQNVTFVELPEIGSKFSGGDVFGVVESVKAASDLFMPVTGEVLEVNEALTDSPELVNYSPYGDGWLLKIKPESIDSLNDLLSSDQYKVEIG